MTATELIKKMNDEFGLAKSWPKFMTVDADTYAHCCEYIFAKLIDNGTMLFNGTIIHINVGPNGGLYFKGVELILDK
jgi:hypothetical protein